MEGVQMSADDKAAAAWNDYVSQQQEEKIEELERQLKAANKRIKRLEDALRRIANQDYRGNRSTESQIAAEALKEAKP
jgi:RNA polymerase-binding transcription factor DksA